jgi:hypothetical protein
MNPGTRTIARILRGGLMLALTLALMNPEAYADWFSRNEKVRGSGDVEIEMRDHESFSQVVTSTFIDIDITVGEEFSVKVEADDNLIEYIETEVRRKTLYVDTRDGYSLSSRNNVRVIVTMPKLTTVDISGSSDMLITGVSGEELEIGITGSGDITLEGEIDYVDISITGSGDIDARDLKCDEAYITISGSGDIDITVESYLDVRVSGSGDVAYWGSPKVSRSISGSGDIRHRRG